jgi:hypothetical protein
MTSTEQIVGLTRPLLGHRVEAVHRWLFRAYDDSLDDTIGPLELSFENGATLTIDAGRHSESVVVTLDSITTNWPAAALERLVRADVTTNTPYRLIVGVPLSRVVVWENDVHYVTAVQFVTALGALAFLAEMDQARVRPDPGTGYRAVGHVE